MKLFSDRHHLSSEVEIFQRGACLEKDQKKALLDRPFSTQEEKAVKDEKKVGFWGQSKALKSSRRRTFFQSTKILNLLLINAQLLSSSGHSLGCVKGKDFHPSFLDWSWIRGWRSHSTSIPIRPLPKPVLTISADIVNQY
jgi:hypothetical protein